MLDASFAAHGSRHPSRLRGETWTAAWPNLKPAVLAWAAPVAVLVRGNLRGSLVRAWRRI